MRAIGQGTRLGTLAAQGRLLQLQLTLTEV